MTAGPAWPMLEAKGVLMDLEMKFLATFYALLAIVTSAVLLVVLAVSAEAAALIVVVVGMFAMMGLLLVTTLDRGSDG